MSPNINTLLVGHIVYIKLQYTTVVSGAQCTVWEDKATWRRHFILIKLYFYQHSCINWQSDITRYILDKTSLQFIITAWVTKSKDHSKYHHHLALVCVNVQVQVNIREVRHKRRGLDISGPFVSQLGHVTLPIFQFLLGKPEKSINITDCYHKLNTKILSEISETVILEISQNSIQET